MDFVKPNGKRRVVITGAGMISGLDIVVIARVAARHVGYKEIESAVLHLGGLHSIIKKQNI